MHQSHTLRNPKRTAEDVAMHVAQAIHNAMPDTPVMGRIDLVVPTHKPRKMAQGGAVDQRPVWDRLKDYHVEHLAGGGSPASEEKGLSDKLSDFASSLRQKLSGKTLRENERGTSEPSISAIPQSLGEMVTGKIGKGLETTGRFLGESLNDIEESHPIRTKIARGLITEPLTSAGTALQDYSGTARDITPDQPYSRVLSNTGSLSLNPQTWGPFLQTTKVDPRVMDIAAVAQPVANMGRRAITKAGLEAARLVDQAIVEGTGPFSKGLLGEMTPKPMYAVAPGKKAQRANAPKNVADVFENVTDPAEALKIAQAGKHLKIDPNTGKYIGLGTHIDSPQALGGLRKRADELVGEGAYNADWYLRQKQLAQDLTDVPTEQSLFARGTAAYSPQAMPKVELPTFARQHNEKMLTGEDVVPRTGSQARNVAQGYVQSADGTISFDPAAIRLGKKTGPYANKKDPTVPVDYKTANDIWHARAFELGEPGVTFDRGLTPQEHGVLHGENLLLADRANKAGIPVGTTEGALHDASTAQAATWAGTRYRAMLQDETNRFATESARRAAYEKNPDLWKSRNPNKSPPPKPRPIMSEEEIRAYASQGLDTAMPAQSAFLTKEAVTGEGLGHLPGMTGWSDADKLAYTQDVMRGIGRDPTIEALGMFSKRPQTTAGEYLNAQGVVEKNPGWQNQVLVSNEKTPKGGLGRITPASEREALDLAARIDAIMQGQQAGAYSRFHPAGTPGLKVSDMDALVVDTTNLDPTMRSKLFQFTQQNNLGAIDHGDRVIIKDFDNNTPATQLSAMLKKSNLNVPFQRGRIESGYEPGLMRFGENGLEATEPGSGEVTRALLAKMDESKIKNLYERLDMSRWRTVAEGKNNLDKAIADSKGLPLRDDLMKLRTIIAESGFTGLKNFVSKHGAAAAGLAGFPAIGLPAVLPTERPAQGAR